MKHDRMPEKCRACGFLLAEASFCARNEKHTFHREVYP